MNDGLIYRPNLTFDDITLGVVERNDYLNTTTFPDIIDDTGVPYSVWGSLSYALAAAHDYITVGDPDWAAEHWREDAAQQAADSRE